MATAAAKRYARAVFELAGDEREIDEWMRRLAQLRDLLSDEKVAAVLTNPTIPSQRRMDLVTSASLDPETTNLAKLLIEADRVREIGAIGAAFGDGLAGNAFISGVARQPEAQGRMIPWLFTIVGLVEAMYFINLAFGFVFLGQVH